MPHAVVRICIGLTALLVCALAHAEGLGRLTVKSSIGQPLRAEVEIIDSLTGRAGGLNGSIGSPDAYKALGIDFDPFYYSIEASVETRSGGPVLVLTSPRSVNEPFLDLVVVLQFAGGRVVREYQALFDEQ